MSRKAGDDRCVYLVLEFIIEKTATVDQIYVDVSWRFVWGNKKKIALSNVTQIHGDSSDRLHCEDSTSHIVSIRMLFIHRCRGNFLFSNILLDPQDDDWAAVRQRNRFVTAIIGCSFSFFDAKFQSLHCSHL
jgi:hypothetical protein